MIEVSDNVSLRLLKMEDAQAVFNIIDSQREYLREWLPFVDLTQKVGDTERAFRVLSDPENPQFCIISDGEIVGIIGFKDTQRLVRKTEIGYWLSQPYQGRGIMNQVVTKILEYAFLVMNMHRVIIKVAVGNSKSRMIPQRIGFVKEGTERESDLLVGGKYTDIVVYSLLRKEYIEKIKDADIKIS